MKSFSGCDQSTRRIEVLTDEHWVDFLAHSGFALGRDLGDGLSGLVNVVHGLE